VSSPFSETLRKTRLERGLNQAELAVKCGFKPSAISHFEAARRAPSFENLRRLADALNVTIDYLLGRQPAPQTVGTQAEQLFRNFDQMTADDQETLSSMAEILAKKNKAHMEGS
jgi:transcriptional regulator with XRE-family HTH domain